MIMISFKKKLIFYLNKLLSVMQYSTLLSLLRHTKIKFVNFITALAFYNTRNIHKILLKILMKSI